MGQEKEKREQASGNWASKAKFEGYACSVCGATPIYEEREIYFETGLCGPHAWQAEKDD